MYYISRHTVELTGQKLTIRRQESRVRWGPNFSRGNEDVSSGALTGFETVRVLSTCLAMITKSYVVPIITNQNRSNLPRGFNPFLSIRPCIVFIHENS